MRYLYMDHASTGYPKHPHVVQAMERFMHDNGSNINRGTSGRSYAAADMVLDVRQQLCTLFGFAHPSHAILTANVTTALNCIIKGLVHPHDTVIVSSLEHNAVMRPLVQVGADIRYIRCDGNGVMDLQSLAALAREGATAIIITHASNVCGTINPLHAIGQIAHEHHIPCIVDCAQSAGLIPIDMQQMHIDALAFTGHKALGGVQGTGGFLIQPDLAKRVQPLVAGGTGSMSDSIQMPPYMPDKFEAGTPNLPGIAALKMALSLLAVDSLPHLSNLFLSGLQALDGVSNIGLPTANGRVPVFALDFLQQDNAVVAQRLENEFGIVTRVGLHCAPVAHQALGTYPRGVVRFSFGNDTSTDDVLYALQAIKECTHHTGEEEHAAI